MIPIRRSCGPGAAWVFWRRSCSAAGAGAMFVAALIRCRRRARDTPSGAQARSDAEHGWSSVTRREPEDRRLLAYIVERLAEIITAGQAPASQALADRRRPLPLPSSQLTRRDADASVAAIRCARSRSSGARRSPCRAARRLLRRRAGSTMGQGVARQTRSIRWRPQRGSRGDRRAGAGDLDGGGAGGVVGTGRRAMHVPWWNGSSRDVTASSSRSAARERRWCSVPRRGAVVLTSRSSSCAGVPPPTLPCAAVRREAESSRQLDHPFVVRLLDTGEDAVGPFVVQGGTGRDAAPAPASTRSCRLARRAPSSSSWRGSTIAQPRHHPSRRQAGERLPHRRLRPAGRLRQRARRLAGQRDRRRRPG